MSVRLAALRVHGVPPPPRHAVADLYRYDHDANLSGSGIMESDRRSALKELPGVLTAYHIDMPLEKAKKVIERQFRKNSHLTDPRYRIPYFGGGHRIIAIFLCKSD